MSTSVVFFLADSVHNVDCFFALSLIHVRGDLTEQLYNVLKVTSALMFLSFTINLLVSDTIVSCISPGP